MSRTEVLEKIQEICKDIFEDVELVITEDTSADDIEAWDSLTNLSLINEIEESFDIALTLDEVNKSKYLGELITIVTKHLSEKGM